MCWPTGVGSIDLNVYKRKKKLNLETFKSIFESKTKIKINDFVKLAVRV